MNITNIASCRTCTTGSIIDEDITATCESELMPSTIAGFAGTLPVRRRGFFVERIGQQRKVGAVKQRLCKANASVSIVAQDQRASGTASCGVTKAIIAAHSEVPQNATTLRGHWQYGQTDAIMQ